MKRVTPLIASLLLPLSLFAQARISGTVTDASTGASLPGANVIVEGTSMGAAADEDGRYTINNVPMGPQTITASVIGYESMSQTVDVTGNMTVDFSLTTSALEMSALEVLASRADEKHL